MNAKNIFIALICVFSANSSFADIYMCPDANGANMVSNEKLNRKCKNITAESKSSAAELERGRKNLIGKTSAQLKKLARDPDQIIQSITSAGVVEKWIYKYEAIVLVNGVVTKVVAIK